MAKLGLSKAIQCKLEDKVLFLIWGVDGVTSHLSLDLSQIASLSKKKTKIIFIDSDTVSEEDVIEGKFLKKDIGKKKAIVCQKRCSAAFPNCEITSITRNIDSTEYFMEILSDNIGYTPLIVNLDCDEKNSIIDNVIDNIYEAVSFRYAVDSEKGYCYFKYKFKGDIITDEFTDEERDFVEFFGFTSKLVNLEIAKTLFLYIDDFLCENKIRVTGTKVDTTTKYAISKNLGRKLTEYPMVEPKNEPINIEIGDKVLIIMIGLGGTGGSLAYEVSQAISNSNKEAKLIFIDGDTVENKNLNRQRFILRDVGSYKAAVTSNRCMNAYDLNIISSTDYLVNENEIYSIMKQFDGYFPIILGCSDSLKLRYLVIKALKNIKNHSDLPQDLVYIDAGNDTDGGQVICTVFKDGEEVTTDFFKEFPEMLEDIDKQKLVTQLSCDELMVSAPQTKGANMSAATGIYSCFDDIINERPLKSYNLTFGNKAKRITIG